MDEKLFEELLKKIDLQDKQIKKLFFITSRNSAELENMRQKKGSWNFEKNWVQKG